ANLVTIDAPRAFEVISMNKAGVKPLTLAPENAGKASERKPLGDILDDNDLTRFDKKKKKRKPKRSGQKTEEAQNAPSVEKSEKPVKQDRGADRPQQRQGRPNKSSKNRNRRERPDGMKPKGDGGEKPQKTPNDRYSKQSNSDE
ncbi:MAG: hypothetical protein K2O12_03645, partial [Muribaculaceae bacterium]|nr:hypothetical protein [Muribaculaceae bacterium]